MGGRGVSDDGTVYVAEIQVNMTNESGKSSNTAMGLCNKISWVSCVVIWNFDIKP